MQITPVKPLITNVSATDKRRLCSFSVENSILGKLNISTYAEKRDGFGEILIELRNRLDKKLGSETLSLYPEQNNLLGLSIEVNPEYRHSRKKNYRFGELLRLASLILMKENKRKELVIYSKDTAVYFHSKYKFEPDIIAFDERDHALNTIAHDTIAGFDGFASDAKILQNKISDSGDNAEEQRTLCKEANKLIKKYINQVMISGTQADHPFAEGMNMVLRANTIRNEKEFFDELFYNHGIDYKI